MNDWIRVSQKHPCPICKKPDWCMIGVKFILCNRVESGLPQHGGGWLHQLQVLEVEQRIFRQKPKFEPPKINFTAMMRRWSESTLETGLGELATNLGVSVEALRSIGAAYAMEHGAWAFPMRDGWNEIIGVRLRNMAGEKWAVKGSKGGIFIPQLEPKSVAYITEGPTDTAAALTLGLFAIGRPSCNTGGAEIKTACKRLNIYRVVIVSDCDDPGANGAERIAKELRLNHVVWVPPAKDLRAFVALGGTAQIIESELKNFRGNK